MLFIIKEEISWRKAEKDGTIYHPLRSGRIWHKVDF